MSQPKNPRTAKKTPRKSTARKQGINRHKSSSERDYQNPVPSRDAIRAWIEEQGCPCSFDELMAGLANNDDSMTEGLTRRTRAMVRDGQLILNNANFFGLPDKMDLFEGRVVGHRDGFGFLVKDSGGKDLYLGPNQMRKVIDGDRVLARMHGLNNRGREEATIISVIERANDRLVGKCFVEAGVEFFEPDNQKISQTFIMLPHPEISIDSQTNIEVRIVQMASGKFHGQVELIGVLGDADAPGMEVEMAVRTHGLPFQFSASVLKETQKFGTEVAEADKALRVDLRDMPLMTIDGLDARDFDDAVYCEPLGDDGSYRLVVAIADVSHYVRIGTDLDAEAYERGTSVYFPDQVIPMLPEALSNGLCSLNPDVDRLCMVCDMVISPQGDMKDYQFYEGIMRSHARLTYDQVGDLLENPSSPEANVVREIVGKLEGHLINLYSVYGLLKSARSVRGAIEFETPETYIVFDEERKIEKIVPRTRNDAHKIIEECMLCANVATAQLLQKYELPGLYRNHETPKEEKFAQLNDYLKSIGVEGFTVDYKNITPKHYQKVLESIQERPDFSIVQIRLLRSMNQAVYEAENKGHFGLGYTEYAHFTSPIRRYPDLLVHRAIRWLIRSKNAKNIHHVYTVEGAKTLAENQWLFSQSALVEAGEHCSLTERRADEASREVEDKLKCLYMCQHLGETFKGIVAGVTNFGLFVELEGIFIEGLVHVSSLKSDYYHFDAVQQTLTGERSNTVFSMGVPVEVIVAGVSVEDRKIDLQLASDYSGSGASNGSNARSNGGKGRGNARGQGGGNKAKGGRNASRGGADRNGRGAKSDRSGRGGRRPQRQSQGSSQHKSRNQSGNQQKNTQPRKVSAVKQRPVDRNKAITSRVKLVTMSERIKAKAEEKGEQISRHLKRLTRRKPKK